MAIIEHILRLLTLRHNGDGLDVKSFMGINLVIALALAISFLRWGDIAVAAVHIIMVILVITFNRRIGVAFALISMGVDAIAFPIEQVLSLRGIVFFAWWELAAIVAISIRVSRKAARR